MIWKQDGYGGTGTSSTDEKEVTGMPNTMYKIMSIAKDLKVPSDSDYGSSNVNYMVTLMET